jgi:hypothetical protein
MSIPSATAPLVVGPGQSLLPFEAFVYSVDAGTNKNLYCTVTSKSVPYTGWSFYL